MVTAPVLYRARTVHRRLGHFERRFAYGMYLWLVDIDDLPRLPRPFGVLARFRSRDHVGDPERTLRDNIDALLSEHGIDSRESRILMLASPAFLGYTFNPLSLFWCLDDTGTARQVVAEVHNTYGERHAYVLRPDPSARAATDKELYVSPFLHNDGKYELRVPVPDERLVVTVRLLGNDSRPALIATLTGVRRTAALRQVFRLAIRFPLPTLRVAALIRWQGIRLWARRVPMSKRPSRREHESRRGKDSTAS